MIRVTDQGQPVPNINELEWVKGKIWANIGHTYRSRASIRRPGVVGWIDLTGILSQAGSQGVDILNGIACDAEHDRPLVTGKLRCALRALPASGRSCSRSSW